MTNRLRVKITSIIVTKDGDSGLKGKGEFTFYFKVGSKQVTLADNISVNERTEVPGNKYQHSFEFEINQTQIPIQFFAREHDDLKDSDDAYATINVNLDKDYGFSTWQINVDRSGVAASIHFYMLPMPSPKPHSVTVYEHVDCRGRQQNIMEDVRSRARLGGGKIFEYNWEWIKQQVGNDRISSIYIPSNPTPRGTVGRRDVGVYAVHVYEHANYQGRRQTFYAFDDQSERVINLPGSGLDDVISSIRVEYSPAGGFPVSERPYPNL